jgi:hypothetical protein
MVVERGEKPERLIVAFSGFRSQLMMPAFDFFNAAGILKCSRILLRDTSRTCYTAGMPPAASGRDALVALLREKIGELAPRTVVFVGTSGGGHAALAYGHLLAPDVVHAFSPFTYGDSANIARYEDHELDGRRADTLDRIRQHGVDLGTVDLARVLQPHNGRTRYFVHACDGSRLDVARARHLEKVPSLIILTYPCADHSVARYLVAKKLLLRVLAEDPAAWLRSAAAPKPGESKGTT